MGTVGCGDSTMARDPIRDGSIALSQVVEGVGGLRGGWQGTHRRFYLVSLRYSTASQTLPMFSATAAIRDESGEKRGQCTDFHLWGAGWVGPDLPGQGSEEGHGSTTVINKVLPSCPPAQKRMDKCLPSAQSWDKDYNTKWVSKRVFLT